MKIKLFSIAETEVCVSPLLLLAVPAAVMLHRELFLAAAFLSLSIHEAAHMMMASRLGYRLYSIEIQPFGFVGRLEHRAASSSDLAAIYSAGPAASFILAAFNALFEHLSPIYSSLGLGLTEFNLLTVAVNLLPALPLDGGRLLYSAASKRGAIFAFKALRYAGIIAGSMFIGVFALLLSRGAFNPTFLTMGVFLTVAAFREQPALAFPKAKRDRLRLRSLPVRTVAFSAASNIISASGAFTPGSYVIVEVIDDRMRCLGVLDEGALLHAATVCGPSATLEEAVALCGKKML